MYRRRTLAAGVAPSCRTAIASSSALTVVPTFSALICHFQVVKPPPALFFRQGVELPKGRRRSSL